MTHHNSRPGERNGRAKLTQQQVDEIRTGPLGYRVTARAYGVDRRTVARIRLGLRWVAAQEATTSNALYSIGTWDANRQGYTRQRGTRSPSYNVDIHGLRRHLRELRDENGYGADRVRFADGSRDSDWSVLVERTDGLSRRTILKRWRR